MYRIALKTFVKKINIIDELNAISFKIKLKETINIIGLYATSKSKNKEKYWNKWIRYLQNAKLKSIVMTGNFNIQPNDKIDN